MNHRGFAGGQADAERLHRELQLFKGRCLAGGLRRAGFALRRADDNTTRPPSQFAGQIPDEFASTLDPRPSLPLRFANSSAPATAVSAAHQGTTAPERPQSCKEPGGNAFSCLIRFLRFYSPIKVVLVCAAIIRSCTKNGSASKAARLIQFVRAESSQA